jgi:hypothetical protein
VICWDEGYFSHFFLPKIAAGGSGLCFIACNPAFYDGQFTRLGRRRKRPDMSVGLANRVRSVGHETLKHLSPLQGLFASFHSPPSFKEAVADIEKALQSGKLEISDISRRDEVIFQTKIAAAAALEAAKKLKNFDHKETLLSIDQIAVLHLYSQQTDPDGPDSLYALMNAVLRNADRSKVKEIKSFVFLFMTAVKICPQFDSHVVYRGVVGDISGLYQNNCIVVWHQTSSCTSSLDVLSNPAFLGTSGARTFFTIELGANTQARRISDFSSFSSEAEVILPPNTRFKVLLTSSLSNLLSAPLLSRIRPIPNFNPVRNLSNLTAIPERNLVKATGHNQARAHMRRFNRGSTPATG